mmetsp:Transcript_9278/g.34629  ORF Transcript_9278/g.34629 Transcript_9278/m.34629 type:complete len:219 (+) Transcript_9278:4109-4765(+)
MNPRSSLVVSSDTMLGRCAAPSPALAEANAALALSRTPCARLRKQLAIFPKTREISASRSRAGKSRSTATIAAAAAGRTVPPFPSLSSTTASCSSLGNTSRRRLATTSGCSSRPTTFVATAGWPVSISTASSPNTSNSWNCSRIVAAARMCSALLPSTSYPRPPKPPLPAVALRKVACSRSLYGPHGRAPASAPTAAAAVDATSAPGSPSAAVASGAK